MSSARAFSAELLIFDEDGSMELTVYDVPETDWDRMVDSEFEQYGTSGIASKSTMNVHFCLKRKTQ